MVTLSKTDMLVKAFVWYSGKHLQQAETKDPQDCNLLRLEKAEIQNKGYGNHH